LHHRFGSRFRFLGGLPIDGRVGRFTATAGDEQGQRDEHRNQHEKSFHREFLFF
jgi:hypothetical protein